MNITEIRIKPMEMDNDGDRLRAFCSATLDKAFVIRDMKVIRGPKGKLFVAMPSRKLTDRCPQCGTKNHLRARFCNECGGRLREDRAERDANGRVRLYADIAHPINSTFRKVLQDAVLPEYCAESARSREPGYVCHYDDYDIYDVYEEVAEFRDY